MSAAEIVLVWPDKLVEPSTKSGHMSYRLELAAIRITVHTVRNYL